MESGVMPSRFTALTLAPAARRRFKVSASSRYTAQWSAVAPPTCGAFTSALISSSERRAALSPVMTASATSLELAQKANSTNNERSTIDVTKCRFIIDISSVLCFLILEIQSQVHYEPPVPWISCQCGDPSEACRIDVRIRIIKIRMVQHIDHIHSEFEFLRFGNPDALDQVHVHAECRRPFNPLQAETAQGSRSRIHEQEPALRIRNRLVAERSVERIQRRHGSTRRIRHLLDTGEVHDTIRYLRDLPHTLRKVSDDIRSGAGSGLSDGRDGRCDRQRCSGSPREDSTQLPSFHETLDEARRIFKECPVRSERQLERPIGCEQMSAVEHQQVFV